MIRVSAKSDDHTFTAKVLKDLELNTIPVAGFNTDPDYWHENTCYKRTIERYEWGAVVVIENRLPVLVGATIVCVGRLDVDNGKVMEMRDGKLVTDIFPQPWYLDCAKALRDAVHADTDRPDMPACLGYHEPSNPPVDTICDGGINEAGKAEPACAYRNRCIPFKAFASERGQLPEAILRGHSPKEIIILIDHVVSGRREYVPPPQPKAAVARKQPAEKPRAVTLPAGKVAATEGKEASADKAAGDKDVKVKAAKPVKVGGKAETNLVELKKHYQDLVADWLSGLRFTGAGPSPDMAPGAVYMVERIDSSKYSSMYVYISGPPMEPEKHKRRAICSFRFKTSAMGFLLQLPIQDDHQFLKPIPAGEVRQWKDGAFLCAVQGVVKGDRRADLCRDIVRSLVARPG